MEYFSFDLNIRRKANDCYPISAKSETFGESEEVLCTSFEGSEFISACKKFAQGHNEANFLTSFGDLLFNSLFQGNIRDLYRSSLGEVARDDQKGVRIRLSIEPPEISAIPWEVLYDRNRDSFLATSTETPLTRYISIYEPIKALKTLPPIRILLLIPGGSGLQTVQEKDMIIEKIEGLGDAIKLQVLDGAVTRSAISKELVEEQYHILHFIGHGAFEKDEAYLVINSEENPDKFELVSSKVFTGYFKDYPWIKLVILNSCQGAEVSKVKPLAGMAPQLVRKGIPAVIAMQDSIPDQAAVLFATEFYRKLCTGWDRGRVDSAISHARNRMQMDFQDTSNFALPVLFMRSPTGVIFDLELPRKGNALVPPLGVIHRLNEVKKTYQQNVELLEKSEDGISADAQLEIKEQKIQIAKIQDRLRRYYLTIGLTLVASGAIFFASLIGVLNVLGLHDWAEAKFINYMHPFIATRPSPELILILAGDENGRLGAPDHQQWRCYNADLLKGLSEVGAEIVAFDLYFDEGMSRCDQQFAEAIKHANEKGTIAIIGARDFYQEEGKIIPKTLPALKETLRDENWGTVEGRRVLVRIQLAQKIPEKVQFQRKVIPVVPSLALQTVMQKYARNQPDRSVDAVFDPKQGQIILRDSSTRSVRNIPVEDDRMEIIINLVDRNRFNKRPYHEVYDLVNDRNLLRDYNGKIVIVGYENEEDKHGDRFGVEIQASAISNLLTGGYFEPLRHSYHYVVITLMIVIGALMSTRFRGWMRLKIPFTLPAINKPLEVPVSLLVITLFYFLLAFIIYKQKGIILNFDYHILALVLGYLIAGWTRRGVYFRKSPRV